MKIILWYILFSFSKRSVFYFIIIKPKAELWNFSLSNIGTIITDFASQQVKSFFWVTVKGSTLTFKYFPTCFCCKRVNHILVKYPSHMVQSLQQCLSLATLLSLGSPYPFNISKCHYRNLSKNLLCSLSGVSKIWSSCHKLLPLWNAC